MPISRLIVWTAAAGAFLAITLGCTAKFAPHLFFKVPNIGFILYAITGGSPIPPYIVQGPFLEGSKGWLKKNDVVVSVGVKAGTTWMLYCSHQIRVKGDEEKHPFIDVMLNTPWPELIQTPGDDWEIQREKMNNTVLPDGSKVKDYWDHDDYPFRIFKSHEEPESFGDLIGGDKVKFLAMSRNGLDVVSSAVPFFDKHHDKFRQLWGNFPPSRTGSIQEEATTRLKQMLPGGLFSSWYFDYVNAWWKARNEKNVLLLHFSDAKKDLEGTVKKMARFYGVQLNGKQLKTVVEKCGFPHMKKQTHLMNYQLPLNPNFNATIMTNGAMTRKGTIGDGNAVFTTEERKEWLKAEEETFGDDPAKLRWAREGGEF